MRDELPDWMDASPDEAVAPSRRLHRLLVLAAVPWLLVAGFLGWQRAGAPPAEATAVETTPHAPTTDEPSAAEPDGAEPGDAEPDGAEPDDAGPDGAEPAATGTPPAPVTEQDDVLVAEQWVGGWRHDPGDGATVAVATATARAWLTGLGPPLRLADLTPSDGRRYAEHLAVEALERPAPGAAVVTFLAVVLEDGADEARLQRLAVPVDETEPQPRPAGPPWPLPVPDMAPRPPAPAEELDPELWPAAESALRAAGFHDAELRGLQRSAGWPVLASIRTPGPDGPLDHVVWLRRHLDTFVVAGLPLTEALPSGPDPTFEEERP